MYPSEHVSLSPKHLGKMGFDEVSTWPEVRACFPSLPNTAPSWHLLSLHLPAPWSLLLLGWPAETLQSEVKSPRLAKQAACITPVA